MLSFQLPYIRDALKKGYYVDKEELTQCVNAVRAAMNVVVPGAMSVMKWIETEIARAIKAGADETMDNPLWFPR